MRRMLSKPMKTGRTAFEKKAQIDSIDWRILAALQEDSRLGYAELARRVHLSAPAVAARIHKLETAGVILGYRVEVGLPALGFGILAFVRVRVVHGERAGFEALVASRMAVLECHHVTGEDCFVLKIAASAMGELEEVVAQLARFGGTTTSIVFRTTVARRTIGDAGHHGGRD